MTSRGRIAFVWLLVLLLPAFAAYPALLQPIEEHSYDAATFHVPRGVLFSAARDSGSGYPRWIQPINGGLGGPLFSFYSPLTYFAMDGLHALGIPLTMAWRILVAVALMAAAGGVYALVLSLAGQPAGAVAASTVYVYSFPVLREFFERGSPQGFAFALLPWALVALSAFIQRPNGGRLALASLAWAALILTHSLSAALVLPLLALIAVLSVYRLGWRALWAALLVLAAGTLLAGVFVLPFAAERGYVQMDNALALDYARVAENPTALLDLLRGPPHYDVGLGNNLIGERAGPLLALVAAAGLLAGPFLWVKGRRWPALIAAGFGVTGLAIIWLQTPGSDLLWREIPWLAYVQARSRLLGALALSAALVAGILVSALDGWRRTVAAGLLMVACLLLALPVLYPRLQHPYAHVEAEATVGDVIDFSLQENVPGLTAFNELLPIWRYQPFTAGEAQRVAAGFFASFPAEGAILAEERGMDRARVDYASPDAFDTDLHLLYFPGWEVTLDGRDLAFGPEEGSGYIRPETFPAGEHSLAVRYAGTQAQRTGVVVSILSAAALALAAVFWRSKKGETVEATLYPAARWWLVAGLALLVVSKALFFDPQTLLFRRSSTCDDVAGASSQAQVRFGTALVLCAGDLPDRIYEPGDTLELTLYWTADKAMEQDAHSFVHLLGTSFNPETGNPLWGQQDKELPGDHPISHWVPGKIYRDHYRFQIDPGAPPGVYQLEIGWVDPMTGERQAPRIVQAPEAMSVSHLDSLLISGILVR